MSALVGSRIPCPARADTWVCPYNLARGFVSSPQKRELPARSSLFAAPDKPVILLLYTVRRIAVREEGVGHDLRGLSSGGIVVRQEVWAVGGWYTLPCRWCTAWVPTHHLVQYQAVDVCVEWAVRAYVLELLARGCLVEASSVRDYLRDLSSRGVSVGQEVG